MTAYVYRAFAADGALLYIGSTVDFGPRIRNHYLRSRWWFAAKRFTFTAYATEAEARAAEVEAIRQEFPRWNVNDRSPDHPDGWITSLHEIARRFPGDDRRRNYREVWVNEGKGGRARLALFAPRAA